MSDSTLARYYSINKSGIDPRFFPEEPFYYYNLPDFDMGTRVGVSLGKAIESNKFLVKPESLLVSKLNPRIKRVWLVRNDDRFRSISSTEFVNLIPNDNADVDYLLYFLQQDWIFARLDSEAVGTTNSHVRFKPDLLCRIESELPSKPEQRKIARILTTVDNLIEKTESLIAKYQAIKQGMMHDLFTRGVDAHGHLRPSQTEAPDLYKQSELGWIPKEWEARTLGDVCDTASGGTPSRDVLSFWNGDIPWVKTGEIKYCVIHDTEERITELGMTNSAARLLPKGTVVLALFGQGPTRGRVGILGIDATVNQACLALLPSVAVANEYLYFALVSAYDGIRSLSNDGAQQNLNSSLVRSFAIPVPDVSEQRHIVAILTSFEASELQETDSLAKLRILKTGLMQDLLTGKVRAKVDETEEVAHV